MYIEKLTDAEIKSYIDSYYSDPKYDLAKQYNSNFSVVKITRKQGKITAFLHDRSNIEITDFDYKPSHIIRLCSGMHDKNWLKFMYEKFGEEYKIAFLEFRKETTNQLLDKENSRLQSLTAEYEKMF